MPSVYQPVPNVAQVKMTYRQGTELMSNSYYVERDTPWSVEDLVTLSDIFYNWENTDGKSERSLSIELTHMTMADLTADDAAYSARAIDPAVGGTNIGQALPLNCTLAVAAVTGQRGRGRQGRTFWIGLTENQVDENVVTNVIKTNIVDNLNSLLEAVNDVAGQQLVVVHRYVDGVKLATGTTTPIITWTVRDTTIDTQKLRLPNHRRNKRPAIS